MVAMFVVSSCTDFVEPAIPYNGFETGTYLKTVKSPAAINFFDLDNSPFNIVLECHAVDKINNVKNVDVYVNHRRGNTVTKEVMLGNVDGTTFTTTADSKWPRSTVNFPMATVLSKLGFSKTNLKGGDFIEYRLVLTTLDGKTFSNNNMSSTLTEEYYKSPFFYRVAIVCPSALAGKYISETTGSSTDDCCTAPASVTSEVTLTAGSATGQYTISDWSAGLYFKFYEVYGIGAGDGRMAGVIIDACGNISGSISEPFGTQVKISGSVDPTNGVITYTWVNGYDDKGTVTLTPKK